MKEIGADECDAAFALTFFHTTLVNAYFFSSSGLFLSNFLLIKLVENEYPD